MQNDINKVISNSLLVNKENLVDNINQIINQIKIVLDDNKDSIEKTNQLDKKNNNGFIMDFNIVDNIFSNIEDNILYGDITLSQKDDELIYGRQIMDQGNIVVITDGNPYVLIEMILRNIMAGNTTICCNNGYMFGTNTLITNLIQDIIEEFNISRNLIQLFISEEFDDILSNFANIDLVICIGDHNLQQLVLKKSKNKTLISGYEHFDLYIEDDTNIDFINELLNSGLDIQLFINEDIKLDYDNSIIVSDIDEAIAQINYNGNRFSSSIFTKSNENASKFIKEVKSKTVTVNTSPSIERIIDINQMDLVIEKNIIYPNNYKINNSINIKNDDK